MGAAVLPESRTPWKRTNCGDITTMNLTISTLRGLLVAAAVALSAPVQGQGIPVIDSSSMAAQAAQHAESLAKYLEQITTLKAQLDRARQQYEAMTGTRNLGDILTDP